MLVICEKYFYSGLNSFVYLIGLTSNIQGVNGHGDGLF